MSSEASGTAGGELVFSTWKGRAYVRRRTTPTDPHSPAQLSYRTMFTYLTKLYPTVELYYGEQWQPLALELGVSRANAFLKYNLERWAQFKPVSWYYPATEEGTPGDAPTVTPTSGQHNARLLIHFANPENTELTYIFRKLDSAPTPGTDTLVAVVEFIGQDLDFHDSPLPPGQWHYIVRGATGDGVWCPPSLDAVATVT
jgi:hypothetical protein